MDRAGYAGRADDDPCAGRDIELQFCLRPFADFVGVGFLGVLGAGQGFGHFRVDLFMANRPLQQSE